MYFDESPKVERRDLYDFDEQLNQLLRFVREGTRLTKIVGLRRTGKTSLLLTALNEGGFPYVVIDGRMFAETSAITRADLIKSLEHSLNDLLSREKGLADSLLDWLKGIRGVEVSLSPPKISLQWGPSRREAADLLDILKSLSRATEKKRKRFVVAFDEAQEFRKLVGYDLTMILAHIYDHVRGLQLIVTGSQVGLLRDFLREDDPKAPLFGRPIAEIEMPHLSDEEAKDFLTLGFKQIGIKPDKKLLDKAVEKLDGIVGWLTHLGVVSNKRNRFDEKTLQEAFDKGARLSALELGNFFASRPLARRRYVAMLRWLAKTNSVRWADLKRSIEIEEGRHVADNIFNTLLQNLVKGGFVRKNEDGTYSVADPLLTHALRSGLVK